MISVLIAYDRHTATTTLERWFDDPLEARRERLRLELESIAQPDVEIVLLEATSRAAVLVTHARYFDRAALGADRLFPPSAKGPV